MMARLMNVHGDNTLVPIIKLKGAYLKEYDFKAGDRIAILYEEHGKLTILNTDIQMQKTLEEEFEKAIHIIE